MHGLPPTIDLSFLLGRRLEQLALGEHQVQLLFDDGVAIDMEGEFSLDGARGTVADAHLLHVLIGRDVLRADRGGYGDLVLAFGTHVLEIHDSNESFESYCVRAAGRYIVV